MQVVVYIDMKEMLFDFLGDKTDFAQGSVLLLVKTQGTIYSARN